MAGNIMQVSSQAKQTQLPLGLRLRDEATFANFHSGRNSKIITELKKTAAATGGRVIYLCGSRGEGRSHLLQAACHEAHQHQRTSVYLPLGNLLSISPDMLDGLETLSLICIDDLQVIAGQP